MIGMTKWNFLVATAVDGKFIVTFCIEAQVDGTNLWNKVYFLIPFLEPKLIHQAHGHWRFETRKVSVNEQDSS